MPDVPLKPDDWKKFSQGLDDHASGAASYLPNVEGAINLVKGLGFGAAKGVAGQIPESVEGKEWSDWASSPGDPSSMMERGGEYVGDFAANVAPYYALPELGMARGLYRMAGPAIRSLKYAKPVIRTIGRTAEGYLKGAIGGAGEASKVNEPTAGQAESNAARGAMEGGMTASEATLARLAYNALPQRTQQAIKWGGATAAGIGAGVSIVDYLGHHHWIPYHALSSVAMTPLAGLAAGVAKAPSGMVGAGAEHLAQQAGVEPRPPQPSEEGSDDEIAPGQ
jgi:hypothetical protein